MSEKIQKIEINFPTPVELPAGFGQLLDAVVDLVCAHYESKNHTRVMWPAGSGSKPMWNEPNEPDFDDTVYCIEVSEREDIKGRNPLNPNKEQLREEQRIMQGYKII